jgi:hypothetical protein
MFRSIASALPHTLVVVCALGIGACATPAPGNYDADPVDPVAEGRAELGDALSATSTVPTEVTTVDDPTAPTNAGALTLDARPGSFLIVPQGGRMVVVGRDAAGAMYGAFELAERVRLDGVDAVLRGGAIAAAPALPIRGANLFLTIPDARESQWWFRDLRFWRAYLNMLAHARINFLDLHGMYNPGNTNFPNALLYFARSRSFPKIGLADTEREQNLEVLRTVVRMARARGIDVGIMTYRSDTSPSGDNGDSVALNDAELRTYTREAAADLARRVPGLRRIGFRIGESGRDAAWFADTIVDGVQGAGTGVETYTRTWGTTHAEILALAKMSAKPPIVEAKFNGEQLGAPYPIAGGIFTADAWTNYSYEGYLDDPAPPYRFVFQLRTGGTHRVFRQASYARAQRTVRSLLVGAVSGFSLEAPHAYAPQRDYYHAADHDRFSAWTFRRDELMYTLYGRLAFDPSTPERVFAAQLERRVRTDALWAPLQAASEIVPWIQTANTCGPDHRDFAPELELGGSVDYWAQPSSSAAPADACGRYVHNGSAYHGPFDSFAIASPYELAQDLVHGRPTARTTPLEVARRVLDAATVARTAAAVRLQDEDTEARDLVRECVALADLGEWFAHKLRGASALAVYAASGSSDYLAVARDETSAAGDAWRALASDTAYLAPWTEPLRMSFLGVTPFHWAALAPKLLDDDAGIGALVAAWKAHPQLSSVPLPKAARWLDPTRAAAPAIVDANLAPTAAGWSAEVTLDRPPPNTTVLLWYKPFNGLASWKSMALTAGSDGQYTGVLTVAPQAGLQFALEVAGAHFAARWPDAATATPYVAIAPATP